MAPTNITLIGINQVGASMGICLRTTQRQKYQVTGYEPETTRHNQAERLGAVDKAEWNLDVAVRQADLIVINTPATEAYRMLENIAPYVKPGATVTDTCDTKRSILHWAEQLLPEHAGFVGGHPVVRTSRVDDEPLSPYLFAQAPYAIVASPHAPAASVKAVQTLAQDVGATPLFIDAVEHDSYTAAAVGMPALLAAAGLNAVSDSPSWHEISKFVSNEFVSMSEPMSNDPSWANGMATTNRDMLMHWLTAVEEKLATLKSAISDETQVGNADSKLADMLVNAWENRLRLELGVTPKRPTGKQSEAEPTLSSGETMMSMLFGGFIYRIFRPSRRKEDPTKYDRTKL